MLLYNKIEKCKYFVYFNFLNTNKNKQIIQSKLNSINPKTLFNKNYTLDINHGFLNCIHKRSHSDYIIHNGYKGLISLLLGTVLFLTINCIHNW